MFITCQQCSTMFRLDETRLKPQGSKVRCSQCGNLFIAVPPAPEPVVPAVPESPAPPAAPVAEATEDRELEGIDLAELDSLIEQGRTGDGVDDLGLGADEDAVEFNETDLDLDFESALEVEDTPPVEETPAPTPAAEDDGLDLDMDFDLDVGEGSGPADVAAPEKEDGSLEDAVDHIAGLPTGASDADDLDLSGEIDLPEDVESALDGFEDALAMTDDSEPDLDLDAGDAAQDSSADQDTGAESAADDLGLDDLGTFLDDATPDEDAAEEPDDVALSLDDDAALSLSDTPEAEAQAPAPTTEDDVESDDLGLGDLGALLDEDDGDLEEPEEQELSLDDDTELTLSDEPLEAAVDTDTQPESGADDLNLDDLGDLDSLIDDDDAPEEAREELELSLSDDDDLALDDSAGAHTQDGAQAPDLELDGLLDEEQQSPLEDTELSLDEDLELSLDDGTDAAEAITDDDDEFDLADFDSLLDDDAQQEASEDDSLELSLDDEPSLELDAADAAPDQDDTIDLSGLDDDINQPVEEDIQDVELELSLDLDDAPDAAAAPEADELEDLEFELDAEFEDKPVSQTAGLKAAETADDVAEPDEEIDLTDIEQMLEEETIVSQTVGLGDGSEDEPDDLGFDSDEELDLSEIEEAIDAADSEGPEDEALELEEELDLALDGDTPSVANAADADGAEELELELEMESAASDSSQEPEDDSVLDMSDLDFSLDDDDSAPSTTSETIDGGDIELEFEIEEDGAGALQMAGDETLVASETESAVTAAFEDPEDADDISANDTLAAAPAMEKPPARPAPKAPAKKGSNKFLVFLLILTILGGGIFAVHQFDIKIPYVSDTINNAINYVKDYFNPKPKDPSGIVNLTTLEINSKFIENEKAGRLFIVTGKVRNGYAVPTTMIRLRGKLFTKGKVLVKSAQSYAGIILTDQELASLEVNEISKRLRSPMANATGIQVAPNQTTPFMVVFSDLPEDLDEFAIELVSSTKVQ